MNSNNGKYTELIKAEVLRLGFSFCGISKAEKLDEDEKRLTDWLNNGMHGQMRYMENHFDKRVDVRKLVPGAKSVVSLLFNYFSEAEQTDGAPKISKYAFGRDYHFVLKEKLRELMNTLQQNIGDVHGRIFVDSAPVLERTWAARGGLGWVGKNGNLINKQHGSYFFLAELILDVELHYDSAVKDFCGTCTRCIDACPTDAIVAPQVVDGSKCISYFTIELKENIPDDMKNKFGGWAFGCDVCQDVCPWNRFAEQNTEAQFKPLNNLLQMNSADWLDLTEEVFSKTFSDSAIARTKLEGMKRNVRFLIRES